MSIEKVLAKVSCSGAALAMGYIGMQWDTLSLFEDGLWITALFEQSRAAHWEIRSLRLYNPLEQNFRTLFSMATEKFGTTWNINSKFTPLIPSSSYALSQIALTILNSAIIAYFSIKFSQITKFFITTMFNIVPTYKPTRTHKMLIFVKFKNWFYCSIKLCRSNQISFHWAIFRRPISTTCSPRHFAIKCNYIFNQSILNAILDSVKFRRLQFSIWIIWFLFNYIKLVLLF